MAGSRDAGAPSSRFTRYFAPLQIGQVLATHCQRADAVELHLRQSHLDGACAHHVLAMALIAMGLVKRSAVLNMSHRRYGHAAGLYAALADHWMDGAYAADVVDAIQQLDLPLAMDWIDGFDRGVDRFAVDALMLGRLVMLAYERSQHNRHWVLGIGCGGTVAGRQHQVDTLLTLDPSLDALPFAIGNGQFKTARTVDFESRRTSVRWVYETVEGVESVRLMSAISLAVRPRLPTKRRH